MAVIAVFNQKGGVGKTTTSLNLVAALARAQHAPVAIDIDPQAHLTMASGLRVAEVQQRSMETFFKAKAHLSALVWETPAHWNLIPSSPGLSKVDALHGSDPQAATQLKHALGETTTWGGTPILIDCCPMLGVLTLNALLAADKVLIPVSADFLSLQGVYRLDSALKVLEQKLHRKFERRIVVTRFDARRRHAYEMYDRLKSQYGRLVCNTRISESASLAASPMAGKDIFSFAPNSTGAAEYQALAAELISTAFFEDENH
jgi:chromosome partitioning protein